LRGRKNPSRVSSQISPARGSVRELGRLLFAGRPACAGRGRTMAVSLSPCLDITYGVTFMSLRTTFRSVRSAFWLVSVVGVLGVFSAGAAVGQHTVLEVGETHAGSIMAGDTARYTVQVGDDAFLLGAVNQISVALLIRVIRPDGEPVGGTAGLGRGVQRFGGNPPEAGDYTVELTVVGAGGDSDGGDDGEDEGDAGSDDAPQGGDYEITLLRNEPLASEPGALADQHLSRYDGDDTPGAAIRVWRDGETIFSNTYGMANLAYGIPFEADTRTNIGSTSKQFTAFAVMLQAERGLLSLDDDIRDHVPELPEFEHTIRIEHLLTHTSGLREFLNLVLMTGRRLDHGDWIDRSELIDIVQRQPKLQNVPGAEWNYNNTGFGLAATIVERTSGQPFGEFMRDNVFLPLGMTRTMVRADTRRIVPDQSEGYTPGPMGYRQIGDLGGAVGAGGIYSTIEDLQKWVENMAAAEPTVGTRKSLDRMMTSFVLDDGEETGYGYGLSVDEHGGLKRVSHGGADVAHRSMLIYYPEINAGITTQSNHASFSSALAAQLAEEFFADALELDSDEDGEGDGEGEDEFNVEAYDPEDFDEFAGRYALDAAPAFVMTFTRDEGTFHAQATGQPRLEIVPTSPVNFRFLVVDASVTFQRDEEGAVTGLILHQNGDQPATRLEGDGAETWEPAAEDLREFAGVYFSPEIETFYRIEFDEEAGELMIEQRRMGRASLEAGERDQFTGRGFTFEFERDRNGDIVAFYLSNGRTRDVRFIREPW